MTVFVNEDTTLKFNDNDNISLPGYLGLTGMKDKFLLKYRYLVGTVSSFYIKKPTLNKNLLFQAMLVLSKSEIDP